MWRWQKKGEWKQARQRKMERRCRQTWKRKLRQQSQNLKTIVNVPMTTQLLHAIFSVQAIHGFREDSSHFGRNKQSFWNKHEVIKLCKKFNRLCEQWSITVHYRQHFAQYSYSLEIITSNLLNQLSHCHHRRSQWMWNRERSEPWKSSKKPEEAWTSIRRQPSTSFH